MSFTFLLKLIESILKNTVSNQKSADTDYQIINLCIFINYTHIFIGCKFKYS
jgi:hypothetical protein